jgi:SAM-dependent MidA family methyltransferase
VNPEDLRALGEAAANRLELWTRFAREAEARQVAEIGVYRGRFAARMLGDCPAIETY